MTSLGPWLLDERGRLKPDEVQRELERLSQRLGEFDSGEAITPWRAIPYAAGWGNYSVTQRPGQYRMVRDEVQCRGLATKLAALPVNGDHVFTLPPGHRPTGPAGIANPDARCPIACGGTVTALAWFGIEVTGIARIQGITAAFGEQDYVDLTGVRFSVLP